MDIVKYVMNNGSALLGSCFHHCWHNGLGDFWYLSLFLGRITENQCSLLLCETQNGSRAISASSPFWKPQLWISSSNAGNLRMMSVTVPSFIPKVQNNSFLRLWNLSLRIRCPCKEGTSREVTLTRCYCLYELCCYYLVFSPLMLSTGY